jgi:hypothetical protein
MSLPRFLCSVVLVLLACGLLSACGGAGGLFDAGAQCARAKGLNPVDRAWLEDESSFEKLFQLLQESRSLPVRRRLEAVITCYRPGDEIWQWSRPAWETGDGEQVVAVDVTGYALVRAGLVLGGVEVERRPGEVVAQ